MTWAFRRQLFYLAILIVFIFVFGFIIIYPRLNKAPTCVDNKQNGDETGIDCGGSCPKACIFQVDQISILWSRIFKVVDGRYNAVAYLENHNKNIAINKISYRFRFADKDNVYIGKREGTTYVPPSGKFAVFEPAIDIGNSIPVYTSFEFTEIPVWIQVSQDKIDQLKVLVSNIKLNNETTSPILSATLKNSSLFQIPEVNVVVILYDEEGNVVNSSRTYLDTLFGEESKEITFTWPEPFFKNIISEEIIPMYNIFSVKLK
ncbi:MAG: hypothetical protein WC264_01805 [Candidatus Paceibacterota bacterium]|jgi:hypothetical protein